MSNRISEISKENLSAENAAVLYPLASLFNLTNLKKASYEYLERCFTIIVDDKNFIELEHTHVLRLLKSSELLITSEIEVYNAANRWLNHNIDERSKYAKNLLLKVRLTLLSDETIRLLLSGSAYFSRDKSCSKLLNDFLECKNSVCLSSFNIHNSSRYCSHNKFSIYTLGGIDITLRRKGNSVSSLDVYSNVSVLPSMATERKFTGSSGYSVCVRGDLYVFGGGVGINNSLVTSVEKYSVASKTWSQVAELYDYRWCFCVCAFMDKVFIFGGYETANHDFCLQFDTISCSWKKIAGMVHYRYCAACAVFMDRIVICGGYNNNNNFGVQNSNTVESYDVLPDKWSPMPNMNTKKDSHSLVVSKNKLFVISDSPSTCEVFDNFSNKFITLSPPPRLKDFFRATAIGNKVLIFPFNSLNLISYDVDRNKWSEEPCELTKNLYDFSCVKVLCLK